MRRSSIRPFISLVLGLGLSVVALVAPAPSIAGAARPAADPTLKLFTPDDHVTAYKYKKQGAKLDAEIFVAAPNAPFEFRLERPRYDRPIHIFQEIGGESRRLPDDILQGWDGFADFFKLRAKNQAGRVVFEGTQRFCPSAEIRQPLDLGSGEPTYILGCQANEFTKGMRWGIEAGWAAEAFGDRGARINVPPGRYDVTITITKRFRSLFDIPKPDSRTTLDVTVEKTDECFECDEWFASPGNEPVPYDPVPDITDPADAVLPDLIPLPPYGINVMNDGEGASYLGFAAHVWVSGNSDLVVEGYTKEDDPRLDAYQYFFNGGVADSRANVGHFHFDNRDGHDHWHLDRFSVYRLLAADGTVITSEKQGFCLGPSSPTDLTIPGAVQNDVTLRYETDCGTPESTWIREVIPLGWGDTYHQALPGQSFPITDLPNGKYFIEIQANPDSVIYEQRFGNNDIRRKVVLGGRPGHRTVDFGPVR